MSENKKVYEISDLLEIMRALRDPQEGCPWDQQQSFNSIVAYTIEEAYEVADAIERHDFIDLCDELGDLLLQVVYHAQMADELGEFGFADVVAAISKKMIRRHPHVFAVDKKGLEKPNWESMKQQERALKISSDVDNDVDQSLLAGVSAGLPPIQRARKIQKKVAKVGFDWPNAEAVLTKVDEELNELRDAMHDQENPEKVSEEFGDLLFALLNVSRHLGLDADLSLQKANSKFERRFRALEKIVKNNGQELQNLSQNEMDEIWDFIKQHERAGN